MDPSISSKENTSLNSNYGLGRMFSFSFLVSKNKGEIPQTRQANPNFIPKIATLRKS